MLDVMFERLKAVELALRAIIDLQNDPEDGLDSVDIVVLAEGVLSGLNYTDARAAAVGS